MPDSILPYAELDDRWSFEDSLVVMWNLSEVKMINCCWHLHWLIAYAGERAVGFQETSVRGWRQILFAVAQQELPCQPGGARLRELRVHTRISGHCSGR